MAKIIFNYKICDKSPQCGGIATCPHGAIYYDEIAQKPVWSGDKCTFCLKCTLPDACPVGAIIYAPDETTEKTIMDTINADPRSEQWLWQERYGVQPSVGDPQALELTPTNFDQTIASPIPVLIDVWHQDYLDCRLHSPLFTDLLKDLPDYRLFKLDAKKYPELSSRLKINVFPSLILYRLNLEAYQFNGYIEESQISQINSQLHNIINSNKA